MLVKSGRYIKEKWVNNNMDGNGTRRRSTVQIHLHSKVAFPINQEFYGNGFVAANTSVGSSRTTKNYILTRCKNNPLAEGPMAQEMQRLSREKYNLELGNFSSEEYVRKTIDIAKRAIARGETPVINVHFPIQEEEVSAMKTIKEALKEHKGEFVIFAYLHCLSSASKSNKLRETLERIRDASHSLIAVSEAVSRDFRDNYGLESHLILNGIDPFLYSPRDEEEKGEYRREIGLSASVKKVVTYVGRIDSMKGSNYLFETMQQYEKSQREEDQEVGFVIGTGHLLTMDKSPRLLRRMMELERLVSEDRLRFVIDISKFTRSDHRFRKPVEKTLSTLAQENGLNLDKNTLAGRAFGGFSNVSVQSIGDIYLHPATNEALGLAIVEGLYTGNYVITTNVGGIPEIITPQVITANRGKILELPGSYKSSKVFVDKIVELIRGRKTDEEMGAVEMEKFTIDVMVQKYQRAIEESLVGVSQ